MKIILPPQLKGQPEDVFEIKFDNTWVDENYDPSSPQYAWGEPKGWTPYIEHNGKEVWRGTEVRPYGCSYVRAAATSRMLNEAWNEFFMKKCSMR